MWLKESLDMFSAPGPQRTLSFSELKRICPDVRVILFSGYCEEDITELFEDGALAGFLQKPYRYEELEKMLRAVLSGENPQV